MASRTRPLPQLFHDTVGKLEQAVRAYQETGVFYVVDDATDGWRNRHSPLLHPITMRPYMRMVAKEEKRPFIWARETRYIVNDELVIGLQLTVPKHTKLEPLVAPLLLVAEIRSRYNHSAPLPNVSRQTERSSLWVFSFCTEEGRALFAHWYEQCRSNPEFKQILNTHLPEEVTPCSSSRSNSRSKSPKKPSLLSARL